MCEFKRCCAVLLACALSAVCAGCSRGPAPSPPRTFDEPLGPIVKTTAPSPAGLPARPGIAPEVRYFANGFAKLATAGDRRAGRSELRVYNPMDVENRVTIRVYFDNRPPEELTTFTLAPNRNDFSIAIPGERADFFRGSEAWAARITSNAPILAANLLSAGVVAPNGDLWFGDPRYKGANTAAAATETLSRQWFFGDGLVLKAESPGPGRPFNEYEWYHVLNPNGVEATVSMRCHYPSGETETFEFKVAGERVRIVNNQDLVRPNAPHAVEFVSSQPVLVSAERFICDFNNTEDWGAWVHVALPGTPVEQIASAARP